MLKYTINLTINIFYLKFVIIKNAVSHIKILFLFIIVISSFKLKAQTDYKIIIGQVVDKEQHKGIPYVHIRNLTDNYGTITDSLGVFKIKILSDTAEFKISTIGYYSKIINIAKDSFPIPYQVFLKYRIYEIMQVDVYPFTKKQFKYEFVYADIKKDDIDIIKDNLKTKFNSVKRLTELTPLMQIPLNFRSRIEKQEELLEKIKELNRLKTKNYERISRVTNYKGKEIYEFDRFCRFSFHFLKNASEYVIYRELNKRWKEYEKIKFMNKID